MTHYAVIDTETTGFGKHDRIIEIAVVVLDPVSMETIDEFDTLVNPDRDVGRTDIHGITASMLLSAPTFGEILGGLLPRLDGAVLVGHNLAYDVRMLRRELERVGIELDKGAGCCTLAMTGSKLDVAAAELDISLENHHRALCDAQVTAEVFRRMADEIGQTSACSAQSLEPFGLHRTLRREATGWVPCTPLLRKLIGKARYPSSQLRCAAYFDMLDWSLADGHISEDERTALDEAELSLQLSKAELAAMHEAYLKSLLNAINRDGRVTAEEAELFKRIAQALGFSDRRLEQTPLQQTKQDHAIRSGACVCFTGSAFDDDGNPIERATLEQLAAAHGLQPVDRVTKKFCHLLVAQDADSRSGKGKVAAKHGIPVMSVRDFIAHLSG